MQICTDRRSSFRDVFGRRVILFLAVVALTFGAGAGNHLWSFNAITRAAPRQELNPGWSYTGKLKTGRTGHTATLLTNGKVLVTGGWTGEGGYLSSTELFDPATGTWSYSGALAIRRSQHTATLLRNGTVLVAGGEIGTQSGEYDDVYLSTNSAELYDPATGSWSPSGSLHIPRRAHTATLLGDGRVLVAGGVSERWVEVYDPAGKMWTLDGRNTSVYGSDAFLLSKGRVLLTGHWFDGWASESFKPDGGNWNWSLDGRLNSIRQRTTATLLGNDTVLVIGHGYGSPFLRMYAEIYDPEIGRWSSTSPPSYSTFSVATLLRDGRLLVVSQGLAELYDPNRGRWSSTNSLNDVSNFFTATLLSDGKVLFTTDGSGAVLFDPELAPSGTVANVSAATYSLQGLASEGIAAAFGDGLATTTTEAASLPLPTQLAGTTVRIKDSAGDERFAPLFFVSPNQVNYQIPPGTAPGPATVAITSGDGSVSGGVAIIKDVAPGLFTANANGEGLAAALVLRIKADGSNSYEPIAEFDAAQNRFVPHPIDLGPEGERVYLVLFGTGIRHRSSLSSVFLWIGGRPEALGGVRSEVNFAGPQGDFIGVDQINVLVPRSLIGYGEAPLLLQVDGRLANRPHIRIK